MVIPAGSARRWPGGRADEVRLDDQILRRSLISSDPADRQFDRTTHLFADVLADCRQI
jgi:hypothetical protein